MNNYTKKHGIVTMMKINDKIVEDMGVLSLEGKLSGIDCAGIIQEKIQALSKKKIKNFILDMSQVNWIDSTGLGELIASLSSTKKKGGNLVLTDIPGPVQSLLEMTNLMQIFDTYLDVEKALSALKD
jgi:anti-sigma B factor antagonist